jgi:hypothetical protein
VKKTSTICLAGIFVFGALLYNHYRTVEIHLNRELAAYERCVARQVVDLRISHEPHESWYKKAYSWGHRTCQSAKDKWDDLFPLINYPNERIDLLVRAPSSSRNGALVERMSEQEQAEVFAFRALAATGLMNPFGERSYNFTYEDDTTRTDAGWRIGFVASDCKPRMAGAGYSFTCTGLSGDHPETGNALADTFMIVGLGNQQWTVVGVEGNMLERERDRVIGYRSAQREEPSHWEFPAVGSWPTDQEVYSEAMALWVGPYPTSAPGSVCGLQAENAPSDVLRDSSRFYQEPPNRPFERAGWIRGIDGPRVGENAKIRVYCQQYTGRGSEVASGP